MSLLEVQRFFNRKIWRWNFQSRHPTEKLRDSFWPNLNRPWSRCGLGLARNDMLPDKGPGRLISYQGLRSK